MFRRDGGRWTLAYAQLHAYKAGLFRSGRDLIETTFVVTQRRHSTHFAP